MSVNETISISLPIWSIILPYFSTIRESYLLLAHFNKKTRILLFKNLHYFRNIFEAKVRIATQKDIKRWMLGIQNDILRKEQNLDELLKVFETVPTFLFDFKIIINSYESVKVITLFLNTLKHLRDSNEKLSYQDDIYKQKVILREQNRDFSGKSFKINPDHLVHLIPTLTSLDDDKVANVTTLISSNNICNNLQKYNWITRPFETKTGKVFRFDTLSTLTISKDDGSQTILDLVQQNDLKIQKLFIHYDSFYTLKDHFDLTENSLKEIFINIGDNHYYGLRALKFLNNINLDSLALIYSSCHTWYKIPCECRDGDFIYFINMFGVVRNITLHQKRHDEYYDLKVWKNVSFEIYNKVTCSSKTYTCESLEIQYNKKEMTKEITILDENYLLISYPAYVKIRNLELLTVKKKEEFMDFEIEEHMHELSEVCLIIKSPS